MMSFSKKVGVAALASVLALGVAGCSSTTTTTENAPAASASPTATKKAYPNNVIDLRDSEEFYAGHLDQSINLPYSDEETFANVVAIMNKDLVYELYGSSEEQVAEVVERLKNAGFSNVKNLGDVNTASETTGLEIIQ